MEIYRINVVKYKGELLFECDGILLDQLEAEDFREGEVWVFKNEKYFDSGWVGENSTYGGTVLFSGLLRITERLPASVLYPRYFQEGDLIKIRGSHLAEGGYRALYVGDKRELANFVFPEHPILRRRRKE